MVERESWKSGIGKRKLGFEERESEREKEKEKRQGERVGRVGDNTVRSPGRGACCWGNPQCVSGSRHRIGSA